MQIQIARTFIRHNATPADLKKAGFRTQKIACAWADRERVQVQIDGPRAVHMRLVHFDLEATLQIYTHVSQQMQKELADTSAAFVEARNERSGLKCGLDLPANRYKYMHEPKKPLC